MGEIELIVGCMFCGKTRELLRKIRMELVSERKVQLFKPIMDNRYDNKSIITHDKDNLTAIPVESTEDIYNYLEDDVNVICIDEIQFFDDKIVDFCLEQANRNKKIIASGLNLDFRGEPFKFRNSNKHIGELMPYSLVYHLRAICKYKKDDSKICGRPADFSQRLIDGKPASYNSPLILVGAEETYEARCRKHFFILKNNKMKQEKDSI